jgi:hypothetical protein
MSKYIWVGRNPGNVTGSSSKAYCIRRQGKRVVIKYGPIEIIGGRGGKYYWVGKHPKVKTKRFRNKNGAIEFKKNQGLIKMERGYHKIPGRVRIREARK